MTKHIKQTVREEVEVDRNDSPAVLAYRVEQLEKTTATGLASVNDKLDNLAHNFATKVDLENVEKAGKAEHEAIRGDIAEVKLEVDELKRWKDTLVNKIAGAAIIMLVLMLLALYGLDKFAKL